ncbi:MAG: hypothetical protein AUH85_14565 [Chloroflexi bacterium 13_1_40CM_4_68_4]|nr:MAG: hypothetical protein AUH85_14565 [Chloroflexi bacterium 13_1_40CM_4_68_4]
MDSLRVLVADDSGAVRESLAECLSAERDLQVIGHAADGPEALRLAQQLRPDVLLLDNSMPGLTGLEVARALRRSHPQIAIIMYTADGTCRLSAIAAGASAVMTKDEPIADLVQNIRSLPKVRAKKAFAQRRT